MHQNPPLYSPFRPFPPPPEVRKAGLLCIIILHPTSIPLGAHAPQCEAMLAHGSEGKQEHTGVAHLGVELLTEHEEARAVDGEAYDDAGSEEQLVQRVGGDGGLDRGNAH